MQGTRFLYPTDSDRVITAGTYLRGAAYKCFQPHLIRNSPFLSDFQLFVTELTRHYGDPDLEATKSRELKALKQTNSAAKYRSEFDSISSYLAWDTSALKSYFYDGLKPDIKDAIAFNATGEPESFTNYQDWIIKIDDRIYQRKR